ncbi:chaplin family protein [Phytohabitans sp. LJ34]|uniref:chaplin family protein n=1 Tax=Phytohabitans sp. LJ34 TaxID=3452217 RepID=UPI003F89BF75
MKTWVRKTLSVGVLAAGALLFAPSAVQADTAQVSIDNNGIANGNQAYAPIQIPVNVCGNGVGAVIGVGVGINGACVNGAAQDVDHRESARTESSRKNAKRTEDTLQFSWGNDGIANGNQAYVPVQVPVNVCGNGVGAVIGVGVGVNGICANGAAQDVDHKESKRTEDTAQVSGDNDGILNGNQIYVPVQVPINICGNGVGVLGVGAGISGACINSAAQDVDHKESSRTEDTLQWSGDNDGILNGNQIYVPIQVPINICGNGVGVVGVGVGVSGACFNGAIHDADIEESKRTEDTAQVSGDNDGILNGNQAYVPIQIPINVCGNGVGVVGVGVGISGACVNGAAQDVDVDDDDDNGHHHYKGKKSDKGGDHGYYKKESLPLVGGLAGTLAGGLPTGGLPTGGDTSSLPVAGDLGSGVKTSKVNVAGVDPMGLLNQVPA